MREVPLLFVVGMAAAATFALADGALRVTMAVVSLIAPLIAHQVLQASSMTHRDEMATSTAPPQSWPPPQHR